MHNDPALGGYTGWSFVSISQLQVPGCCKHDNPALGGYIVWSIQFLLVTGMNNMDFFLSGSIYIEASLKPSLCSAQDLRATGIILLSKNYFQILCFEQTGLTRRHQPLRPCVCNPASSINMNWHWQQSWPGIIGFYNPVILVILNRQVLHLQAGWISVEYFRD